MMMVVLRNIVTWDGKHWEQQLITSDITTVLEHVS